MNETRIIFRFPVSKLVNVSYRGRRVISKAESLGCTLDCGFKIPRRQASHHGTRLWIVGINKFPVSENAEGTIRGKIDKARICTKLRPLLSFIVFSISYTNIFLSPPSFSLFLHPFFSSLIVLPASLFLLLDSPIVFLRPRSLLYDRPLIFYTFLSVPFLIFISRIPPSPPRLTLHLPFFSPLGRKNADGASKDRSPRGNRMSNIFVGAGGQLGIQVSLRTRG